MNEGAAISKTLDPLNHNSNKDPDNGRGGGGTSTISSLETQNQKSRLTASTLKELNNSYQSGYLSEDGEIALVGLHKLISKVNHEVSLTLNKKGEKKTLGSNNNIMGVPNRNIKKVTTL